MYSGFFFFCSHSKRLLCEEGARGVMVLSNYAIGLPVVREFARKRCNFKNIKIDNFYRH